MQKPCFKLINGLRAPWRRNKYCLCRWQAQSTSSGQFILQKSRTHIPLAASWAGIRPALLPHPILLEKESKQKLLLPLEHWHPCHMVSVHGNKSAGGQCQNLSSLLFANDLQMGSCFHPLHSAPPFVPQTQ